MEGSRVLYSTTLNATDSSSPVRQALQRGSVSYTERGFVSAKRRFFRPVLGEIHLKGGLGVDPVFNALCAWRTKCIESFTEKGKEKKGAVHVLTPVLTFGASSDGRF